MNDLHKIDLYYYIEFNENYKMLSASTKMKKNMTFLRINALRKRGELCEDTEERLVHDDRPETTRAERTFRSIQKFLGNVKDTQY